MPALGGRTGFHFQQRNECVVVRNMQVHERPSGVFFSVIVRFAQTEFFLVSLARPARVSYVHCAIVRNSERRLSPHLCAPHFLLTLCPC
jgi:hypothetical protein